MATTVAVGTGAGTGGTATLVSGNDTYGIVEVVTGTSLPVSAELFKITYGSAYVGCTLRVNVLPYNERASELAGCVIPAMPSTLTDFSFKTTSNALPEGATLRFAYAVQFLCVD
jgi:hypothetical protein